MDVRPRLHRKHVHDGNDHEAGDECDERVEYLDAPDAALDRIRLLHV